MLIEKPIVEDPEIGRKLQSEARAAGFRYRSATSSGSIRPYGRSRKLIDDLSIVSISTKRLGPPPEREIGRQRSTRPDDS